jgi:hypothetical protein
MISFILFLAFLIWSVLVAIKTRANAYTTKKTNWGEEKSFQASWLFKPLGLFLIGIFVSLFQPFAVEKIDAGARGLKISLIGDNRGVTNYQYKTGWVVYNSWTEQVLEFPTYQQHIEYEDQIVILKGGFSASIKPTFNYSLKNDAIGDMFVNLRKDINQIEQGWLKNAIVGAVNDVANTWEVDSIFNNRQDFENSIVRECNIRLSKWFIVSQLRTNIIPPEALQEAIVAKTKAIQQAEASEQQALTAIAEGKRKVAVARADSAEAVINAQASALAMKIKQRELTPLYVEFLKAQKWNGSLPTTVAGNGGLFMNIKN